MKADLTLPIPNLGGTIPLPASMLIGYCISCFLCRSCHRQWRGPCFTQLRPLVVDPWTPPQLQPTRSGQLFPHVQFSGRCCREDASRMADSERPQGHLLLPPQCTGASKAKGHCRWIDCSANVGRWHSYLIVCVCVCTYECEFIQYYYIMVMLIDLCVKFCFTFNFF